MSGLTAFERVAVGSCPSLGWPTTIARSELIPRSRNGSAKFGDTGLAKAECLDSSSNLMMGIYLPLLGRALATCR